MRRGDHTPPPESARHRHLLRRGGALPLPLDDGNAIDSAFVGADDSVGPIGNGAAIIKADRVVRPYTPFAVHCPYTGGHREHRLYTFLLYPTPPSLVQQFQLAFSVFFRFLPQLQVARAVHKLFT